MCTTQACRLSGKENFMKPMREFHVRTPSDFLTRLLPQGAWARCSSCAITRRGALAGGHNATTDSASSARPQSPNPHFGKKIGGTGTKALSAPIASHGHQGSARGVCSASSLARTAVWSKLAKSFGLATCTTNAVA